MHLSVLQYELLSVNVSCGQGCCGVSVGYIVDCPVFLDTILFSKVDVFTLFVGEKGLYDYAITERRLSPFVVK